MSDYVHAIRRVAQRTGLSAHAVRIWEKRYGAVKPERTATNRRLYSEEQIEKLNLLRDLTRNGHRIGHVAKLPLKKLRDLARESSMVKRSESQTPVDAASPSRLVAESLAAVRRLDYRDLENALKRGAVELGTLGLLQRVISPLAQSMGDLWRAGVITAAHEHFASAVLRVFLGQAGRPSYGTDTAPVLIVATPTGQIHELGALLAGAVAANLGWHVIHLGASLPAAEIAGAALQNRARAVALSIVYPEDDSRLAGELKQLRELLPKEVALMVGGRAASAYQGVFEAADILAVHDLEHFGKALDGLRKPSDRRPKHDEVNSEV